MNPRTIAVGLAAALALVACGDDVPSTAPVDSSPGITAAPVESDDGGTDEPDDGGTSDPGSGDDATETGGSSDGSDDAPSDAAPPDDAPTPTISPDLPDEFLDGVGPIAVVGEPLPALPDGDDDPAVGSPAPVIVGETLDGEPVRIDAAVDGPTWLVFLAHWCPHCNDEIPVINGLRDAGSIPDDVRVVAVSTASNPGRPNWPPAEWLADTDWTYPAVLDGVDVDAETFIAAEAFGLTAFPFSVLVDGDGDVAARWAGGREADELVSLVTNSLL